LATRKRASDRVYWGPSPWRSPVPTPRIIIIGLFIAFVLVMVVDYYRKKQ
jgi:hypothetical protein